jgi:hypothetical protein
MMSEGQKAGSAFSTQVGGSHYKELAIQPLEFIVANNLDFPSGNVVKYVVRYKLKGGLEDLKKARHYLDLLIELEEKKLGTQGLSDCPRFTNST